MSLELWKLFIVACSIVML